MFPLLPSQISLDTERIQEVEQKRQSSCYCFYTDKDKTGRGRKEEGGEGSEEKIERGRRKHICQELNIGEKSC